MLFHATTRKILKKRKKTNKTCYNCDKTNHFARDCRSKNVIKRKQINVLSREEFKKKNVQKTIETWKNQWKKQQKKDRQYQKLDVIPGHQNLKYLSSITDKLTVVTVMQLKFEHGYFRSFQKQLDHWKNQSSTHNEKCTGNCNSQQMSKHLLLNCMHLKTEIADLKKRIDLQTINLKVLFNTKIKLKNLVKFLTSTKTITRR